MLGLESKVENFTKVGKALSKRLKYLGIETVYDLFFYFPFRYENFTNISIGDLRSGMFANISGIVDSINIKNTRFKKSVIEIWVSDGKNSVKAIWFNQPWISKIIIEGQKIYLSGKVAGDSFGAYFNSPIFSENGDNIENGFFPVYSLTAGLTQKQLRFLTKKATTEVIIEEYLPKEILNKEGYLTINEAISQIHFPLSEEDLKLAQKRLAFEELFYLQLASQLIRKKNNILQSLPIKFNEIENKKFINSLDFELTIDQKKSAWEIIQDMEKSTPMNRLLEGDVGSGKTIVAFLAVNNAVNSGYQSVIMSPTEILATQHYNTALKIFKKQKINIALLCRAQKFLNGERILEKELLDLIEKGKVDFIVGTHSVIQDKVKFKNLALAIIDEQHRFGVEQRHALRQKSNLSPHFLSMTATPIPRSLALIKYGDLDVSIIKQMPKGRKTIITKAVPSNKRKLAYDFIRKQIDSGRQAFVICPLIDPSDVLGVRSVKEEFEKLDKNIFPQLSIGLLHGKLKSEEKESVMKDFLDNKIQILVSTSVVEVGVDVPNASVMMIEGSERFGLSQLHQFRGRVGRGQYQSYCFLFSESVDDKVYFRLKFLENCNDGFELANFDLENRGSGSIFSTQQSGYMDFKVADLNDIDAIKKAQEWAKWCIDNLENDSMEILRSKMNEKGFTSHRE